jgi:hypothetical protein
MPFSLRTLNAFEMTHRLSCCEIPPIRSEHRAFVGVYPPNPDRRTTTWTIKRFEIPARLVHEYFSEDDIVDSQVVKVNTLEGVEDVLRSWAITPTLFDAPWKCDWPL